MTMPYQRPPKRVPPLGTILFLRAADYRYSNDADLTIKVTGVRLDLSVYYDGDWVWVEGYEYGRAPHGSPRQVLVRCAALPDTHRVLGYAKAPLPCRA